MSLLDEWNAEQVPTLCCWKECRGRRRCRALVGCEEILSSEEKAAADADAKAPPLLACIPVHLLRCLEDAENPVRRAMLLSDGYRTEGNEHLSGGWVRWWVRRRGGWRDVRGVRRCSARVLAWPAGFCPRFFNFSRSYEIPFADHSELGKPHISRYKNLNIAS